MSFLYGTHRHDLFYITVKYHDYIPNSFQVMEGTWNCIWNHHVILARDTSLGPVIHSSEVSWLYSKGYSSYRADTKLQLKWSRGNNSESMTARVAIIVCDTLSWPVLHNYKVSSKYSKRFSSYGADTKLHLKPSRGNNSESMKRELSFLYATHHHDLFYITVKYHDYIPNSFQVMERTRNCIWNHQGEITQKVWKWELSFLYGTHRHDLFYILRKYDSKSCHSCMRHMVMTCST